MAEEQMAQKMTLLGRKKLTMTGVQEVISFDETAVVLKTSLGDLLIQGTGLQLKELSPQGGQMAVEGTVSSMSFEEPRDDRSWVRRLFG